MKRSVINTGIDWAIDTCKRFRCALPDFAYWTPEQWEEKKASTDYMRKVALGWDVTDYDTGDFEKVGAVLFTLRNGEVDRPEAGTVYCEKYIVMKAGQLLPCHFHYFKTEDIINRAGGTLRVYVWNSTPEADGYQKDLKSDVHLMCDGQAVTIPAGGYVDIKAGNSITLTPHIYHSFVAVQEDGDLVVGEVSRVNDDAADNHFNPPVNLPPVAEDEPARHQLCGGYKQ
ncbi:D-lyxose/D-mannose family sugar isomerase [Oscillibacter sp.]|uniref:D-lyxose/D-mannose family sugar isomerase n=1 Tax=Oscillibacter sp. TaxID=1945593 RepID=UPI003392B554